MPSGYKNLARELRGEETGKRVGEKPSGDPSKLTRLDYVLPLGTLAPTAIG